MKPEMYLLQILLPLLDNRGEPLDNALFGQVRSQLMDKFGGFTAFTRSPAEGVWISHDDDAVRDQIVVFEVMVRDLDLSWWRQYRAQLEEAFHQEHIVIRAQQVILI